MMELSDVERTSSKEEHNINEDAGSSDCDSVDVVDDAVETNDLEQPSSNNLKSKEVVDKDILCESLEEPTSIPPSNFNSGDDITSNDLPLMKNTEALGCHEDNSKTFECNSLDGEVDKDGVVSILGDLIDRLENAVVSNSNCSTSTVTTDARLEKECSTSSNDGAKSNADEKTLQEDDENTEDNLDAKSILASVESESSEHSLDELTNEERSTDQLTNDHSSNELINETTPVAVKANIQEPTADTDMCNKSNYAEDVEISDDSDVEILQINESNVANDCSQENNVSSTDKDSIVWMDITSPGNSLTKNSESNHLLSEPKLVDSDKPLDMSITPSEESKADDDKDLTHDHTDTSVTSPHSSVDQLQGLSKSADESTINGAGSEKSYSDELDDEETGFPAFFKGQVTVGQYKPVMGDFTLKSNEALVDCASLIAPYLVKEPDEFPPSESKNQNNMGFFNSSIGNFLIGLGFSRVREWYHRDMARVKSRRIKKSGKTEDLMQELKNHQTHYLQAKKANEHFALPYKKCGTCNYVTESSIVLEGHMSTPHITPRREYLCGYCSYLHRDPKEMLNHTKTSHGKIGHIEPPSLSYECFCCIFETNSRVKLNMHLGRCLKYFNHSKNQVPAKDIEFPCLTPKPITVSIVKSYEKSINSVIPSRGRPRKMENMADYYGSQNHFYGTQPYAPNQTSFRPSINIPFTDGSCNQFIPRTDQMYPNANSAFGTGLPPLHHLGNNFIPGMNSTLQNNMSSQYPHTAHKQAKKSFNSPSFGNNSLLSGMHPFSKGSADFPPGMPPLPRLQGPYPTPMGKDSMTPNIPHQPHNLVVCEICDGYIKDLEQLRMHMQLIHKVKIHPKMLSSRPPLNCQKCLWRFFTDHGLERHLLGVHGLVTSNMQELANKGKDTGCCTICGRVYASKLVAHMNQVHKIPLKPAHLSYKCTVCSATFGLYRLFENHVYLVHAGGTKRPSTENLCNSKKSLKLNNTESN